MRLKKKRQVKAMSIAASFLMAFSLLAPVVSSAELSNESTSSKIHTAVNDSNKVAKAKVSDRLLSKFKDDEKVTFLVKFKDTAEVEKIAAEARKSANQAKLSTQKQEHMQRSAVIAELKATALTSQQLVKGYVEKEVEKGNADSFQSYHIVNGMAVTATKEVAEKIATFAEVEKILPNETRELYTTVSEDAEAPQSEIANVEWNVERVGAPAVWDMGIDGTGTVVASIDSGVDWDHPALLEKYRGYDAATGEVDHTYSWYDATAGQDVPYDDQGHGTHVTGTMVGSEPDGSNQVGVAPGAKYIAVKAFTAAGGTDADLLDAAQWIMAPGGDATKAPDVVNNSWGGGPGLDEWYRDVVIAWRAAEIFPEFSAGNTTLFNPGGPESIATPANYPESFATGATDINDNLANFSLEGPSPYDEIKPDISAPGVNIRSTVPGGGYEGGWNGTSMAGPAVSGVVALMIQANASLSVDEMEQIILDTATPLTNGDYPDSPNNGFGYGLVDAYSAVSSLVTGLGRVNGQVGQEGEDKEAPTFEHVAPSETYAGMDLPLEISVQDNVSVSKVELQFRQSDEEEWQILEAERINGDYRDADYQVTISGDMIADPSVSYRWSIQDYGNNDVTSDIYEITVNAGITVGYSTDFEAAPIGWTSYGENNTWEWGVPTYGPDGAFSGEKVYATNLSGDYSSSSDMMLVMPPIDLPEGDSYLQFKHWHEINAGYDFGYVVISTDQENWEQLAVVEGDSGNWEDSEFLLSQYAGERVYIGFHFTSSTVVNEAGWYLDDVKLSDTPLLDDSELPTYDLEAPSIAYDGMNLPVGIDVQDNISVQFVELQYQVDNEWQSVGAELVAGDDSDGTYEAIIPGDAINESSINYRWLIKDYGGNEVISDSQEVQVGNNITVGYYADLETDPGWIREYNSTWELGAPTSGPGKAISGENVFATILDGDYPNYSNDTLTMPPIDLPEGDAFLQLKQWYMFEDDDNDDFGEIRVSTDQENWESIALFGGQSNIWQFIEADLSDFAGQKIYIAFHFESDNVTQEPGWYIDDVAISDSSIFNTNQLGLKQTQQDNSSIEYVKAEDTLEKASELKKRQSNDSNKALETNRSNHPVPQKVEFKTENNVTEANVSTLPLNATVSVLESGQSVQTNPADGTYSLLHAAGDFTFVADAYGFHPEEQTITIDADDATEANFTLEEMDQNTVSGAITDETTGEPVEGATVMLVEDANVDPVTTDAEGNFTLTAYEGTYTLKIVAAGFHGTEVNVNLEDGDTAVDIALEPFYTVPGGEIGYDDGTAENARAFYDAGNGWAVKMSLPEGEEQAIVTDGVFQFHGTDWPNPGGTEFAVEVWDATGPDGMPGEKLAGPIEAEATRSLDEWTVVDLSEHAIQVTGDFYMVYIQTGANPNVPGLATDENGTNAERSYQIVGGAWSPSPAAEGNYMIRARVSYEVEEPVITSPTEDIITNETEITVEGTASPTTTVQLLNNGEEVGIVEVGDNGEFAIPTELIEGENEFTVVSLLEGTPTGESESVTVTLDSEAPELTITSPEDGDKSNRETVIVEGTVADTNLDFVKVNGQEATVTDGNYSTRIVLNEGENTIEVVAADLAGNSTTESVTIDVDYTTPEIENLTPTEDKYINTGQTVKIEFDSEPGLKATYIIHMPLTNITANATELPMMEMSDGHYVGYWTATSKAFAEGAVIEVQLVDSFGNEVEKEAEGKLYINVE